MYVVEPVELPATIVITFGPTFRFIAPLALPLATTEPFTVIDAFADVVVGVTVIEATEFATPAVYCRVAALNAGTSVPTDSWRFDKVAIGSGVAARVTVTVYVVCPAELLTTMVMAFEPTLRFIAALALPLATTEPFTVIVAFADVVVGVTVIVVTVFATLAVYCVVAALNAGVRVPVDSCRFDKVAIGSGAARVTVTV